MDLMKLARRIKLKRKEKGFSQEELAEYSGVARSVIQRLEAGSSTNTTINTLQALAGALDTTVQGGFGIFYQVPKSDPKEVRQLTIGQIIEAVSSLADDQLSEALDCVRKLPPTKQHAKPK